MGFQRRITVEGVNLARFVQSVSDGGIRLTNIRRPSGRQLTAVAEERALPRIMETAQQGGWRIIEGQAVGAGRLYRRAVSRWVLLGMICVAAASSVVMSRVMWRVEITGAGAYEADAVQALLEAGVTAPQWRTDVDPGALRDMLEWRYPDVAWVECGWRGMTLHIRFVKGIAAEGATDTGQCDVVAARDGVVVSIVTRAGTPVVAPGDMVRAGDVLIRGEERSSQGTTVPVAARGSIMARVWDSAAVRTSLRVTETIPTGRSRKVIGVSSPWFRLWRDQSIGFAYEEVSRREMPLGGFFWPLTVCFDTRMEADLRSVITDYRSVLADNNDAARQRLVQSVTDRESIVDIWVNWSIIDDEILLSVATAERVVDIAQQERASGMAAPEEGRVP